MVMINVRGSNGAGKTTVSQRLIVEHPHVERLDPPRADGKGRKKPIAFELEGGVFCVGRQQSGLDGIFPMELIDDLLRYYAPMGHVIWENVLVSGNVSRWRILCEELEPVNHQIWATLDTSSDECIRRVHQRREARAAEGWKHRNPEGIKEEVMRAHYRRVIRAADQAKEQGLDVRRLDNQHSYELVHDALVRAGWDCPVHGLLRPDLPEMSEWSGDDTLELIMPALTARQRVKFEKTGELPALLSKEKNTVTVTPPGATEIVAPSTIDEGWDISAWE